MKRLLLAAALIAAMTCLPSCHRSHKGEAEAEALPDTVMTDNVWVPIDPMEINMNPVANFAKDWMALCVGKEKDYNAMTIAWGAIGELWGKPVLMVFVSSDRYTKQMLDGSATFSVVGFPETKSCKDALIYIGSHSHRDEPDKCSNAGLHVEFTALGNPVFTEGDLAIECKKLYSDAFKLDLIPEDIRENMYSEMGVHSFYIGEITAAWEKK